MKIHPLLIVQLWTQEYDALLDEFMMACKQAYGEKVLVQVRNLLELISFDVYIQYPVSCLSYNPLYLCGLLL